MNSNMNTLITMFCSKALGKHIESSLAYTI